MFATVTYNGMRGSWFNDLAQAIEYAERMLGVIAIEQIGVGIVWNANADRLAIWAE